MQVRDLIKPNEIKIADEQKDSSSENSPQFTDLPDEVLLESMNCYLMGKDTTRLSLVNKPYYGLFQPDIGKTEAKEAAKCAINPTKENVEKLTVLLKACPPLLLHPVTVTNRHYMAIKGTIYQIALHEGDDELIDDVIKPAFKKLHNGLETMEVQHETQLPFGWLEAEEKRCEQALTAIDNVFSAFKEASHPNDVTELPHSPFTITINNQPANKALEAYRKAIDALYQGTDKVIESGRDPSVRLLERVIERYEENYDALGGFNKPRNNALMRSVFGYSQRFAPINFMQAFAMGVYYIVEEKKKLTRSFEYRYWPGNFIMPLDSDPLFRLGYEYYGGVVRAPGDGRRGAYYKTFCQSKTTAALQSSVTQHPVHSADGKRCVMM